MRQITIHGTLGTIRRYAALSTVLLALFGSLPAAAQSALDTVPGFVDGSQFVDLVGDDGVTVEVNLHGALLRAITRVDADLARMVGGLESIHAVVLELGDADDAERVRAAVSAVDRRLRQTGWERLATVRDRGGRVHVLVLNDEEVIRGLVVMAVEDNELVFANIAGEIDLAALAELGDEMDLPGLDALDGLGR